MLTFQLFKISFVFWQFNVYEQMSHIHMIHFKNPRGPPPLPITLKCLISVCLKMRKVVNSSVIIFLNCKIRFVYTWYRFPIHLNLWNKIFAIKKRYNKSDTALLIWYTGIWFIKINMQLSNQIVLMFVW